MRDKLGFWAFLVVGIGLCHWLVLGTLPRTWQGEPPPLPDFRKVYLSHDQGFGLDYYVVRFGLFGLSKTINEADVLCYSSSKGLFGYDPDLLSRELSTPERPLKVMNLSFGFGEGFGYLAEVIRTLDLHDKVVIADLTDNTSQYQLTSMGQLAMQTESTLDAYKLIVERWMWFGRDYATAGSLPRIRLDAERGFQVETTLGHALMYRNWETGATQEVAAREPLYPVVGKCPWPFDIDGRIQKNFLDECSRRNLRIIFTSIPYQGYDPVWGKTVAQALHRPHVTVDDSGIELFDPVHMSTKGRLLFSQRLGSKLRASGLVDSELRQAQVNEPRWK